MSRGAAEAMISDCDGPALESLGIDIPKVKRSAFLSLHAELLVEVAVVNLAAPTHTQVLRHIRPATDAELRCL